VREEAYNTLDTLKSVHSYRTQPATAGASMKRHMRVSAEMANLPSLAVNFASSILVRQDETSMDFLRACITGPSGAYLVLWLLPHRCACSSTITPYKHMQTRRT